MILKNQVCSRKLSEKIEKLRVKQHTLWGWFDYNGIEVVKDYSKRFLPKGRGEFTEDNFIVSAFTVAELGEMLPRLDGDREIYTGKDYNGNFCGIMGTEAFLHMEYAKTEANARARMLVYLRENKLINLKEEK